MVIIEKSRHKFIDSLEDKTLPCDEFTHEAHIFAAWSYLHDFEHNIAIKKCCNSINNYAANLGATEKFSLTVSVALLEIIACRINEQNKDKLEQDSWEQFILANQDIFNNAIEVLLRYYDENVLFSELAKKEFVQPKKAFDCL